MESGFSRTFGDGPPEGGPHTDVKNAHRVMVSVTLLSDRAVFEVEGLHKKLILEVDDPAGVVDRLLTSLRK